jgi:hypothetical protein
MNLINMIVWKKITTPRNCYAMTVCFYGILSKILLSCLISMQQSDKWKNKTARFKSGAKGLYSTFLTKKWRDLNACKTFKRNTSSWEKTLIAEHLPLAYLILMIRMYSLECSKKYTITPIKILVDLLILRVKVCMAIYRTSNSMKWKR